MAAERLSMRKSREILRQKWKLGMSHRKVARSLGVGVGTVWETESRALIAGVGSWAAVEALDDEGLEERLYGREPGPGVRRPMPDCSWIHTELRRAGVTLQLLHLEYLERHPDGYRYSQYCEHYRQWVKRQRRSMRQVHRAGEKLFVDYSGQKPHYVDPQTGEVVEVELFVAGCKRSPESAGF
jgi:transposase